MTTCFYYVSNSLDISGLVRDEKKSMFGVRFLQRHFIYHPGPLTRIHPRHSPQRRRVHVVVTMIIIIFFNTPL